MTLTIFIRKEKKTLLSAYDDPVSSSPAIIDKFTPEVMF